MEKQKFEVVDLINEVVISGLTEKGLNWFKPWKDSLGNISEPPKWINGDSYSGVNRFMLNHFAELDGCEFNQWLTYNQAQQHGGRPQKGKSREVIYWSPKWVVKKDGLKDKWFTKEKLARAYQKKVKGRIDSFVMTKYFRVWNVAHVDGVEPKKFDREKHLQWEELSFEPKDKAEAVMDGWSDKPEILEGAGAWYSPTFDQITMPTKKTFCDSDSYYKTLFHESVHATGHQSRLNRESLTGAVSANDTRKQEYSKEELVAEIGAMYLTGLCDLNPKDNLIQSKAYINGWISHLKEHKYEATAAMQKAEKAINYILNIK